LWSIYDGRNAEAVSTGFGLGSFLAAARQFFDLSLETAEAVEREYAA
jgi:hypothetical protein